MNKHTIYQTPKQSNTPSFRLCSNSSTTRDFTDEHMQPDYIDSGESDFEGCMKSIVPYDAVRCLKYPLFGSNDRFSTADRHNRTQRVRIGYCRCFERRLRRSPIPALPQGVCSIRHVRLFYRLSTSGPTKSNTQILILEDSGQDFSRTMPSDA